MKRTSAFCTATAVLSVFCVGLGSVPAQSQPASDRDPTSLVEALAQRVETMERERAEDRRRIRELEERVAALASAPGRGRAGAPAAGSVGQGNLLNPQITGFLDLGASVGTDDANGTRNRFNLREIELDFRAAVSPQADGVLIVAVGEEVETVGGRTSVDFNLEIEEGYLDLHSLTEDLALRLGKRRTSFGRSNLLHTHDLPQVSRPLAVQSFLGPEGLAAVGASLSWIVPNPWDRYVELTTEWINADGGTESPILGGPDALNPGLVGHLKLFQDVGDTASLEVGGSYLFGRTTRDRDSAAHLVGLDATYLWRDPAREDARSLLLQGELFWATGDFERADGTTSHRDRLGGYVFGQVQLDRNWYTGLRYDYTEFPDLSVRPRNTADRGLSAYVSRYLNETLRLRLEYQHLDSGLTGPEDALMFGVTFYIGAHPPHPYWVNR